MKTNIMIPEKIKIGFQNRDDTYTKMLAYVIYYDHKGKLRKEISWESWRKKDIEPVDYENTPTSGFVLNKKVGGNNRDWNPRQTYVRVYDPRGFEFEINVPNLLYILENTNSIKGKGLEGDFVYGWDGKELVLIPCDSPDYEEIAGQNKIIKDKTYIKAKELIVGAKYKTKDGNDVIYMGRYVEYGYRESNKGLNHWFCSENFNKYSWREPYNYFFTYKSLSDKIISCVSEEYSENYAELFDELQNNSYFSPYDPSKDEYIPYDFEIFKEKYKDKSMYGSSFYYSDKSECVKNSTIYFSSLDGYCEEKTTGDNYWNRKTERILIGTIEDVFNKYKPMYKKEYLANGRFYKER